MRDAAEADLVRVVGERLELRPSAQKRTASPRIASSGGVGSVGIATVSRLPAPRRHGGSCENRAVGYVAAISIAVLAIVGCVIVFRNRRSGL
jgi:hypothetical protein